MQDLIAPFHSAVNNVEATAAAIDKKIIGYLCSYAPEELIHAAGFHPLRLFSSQSGIVRAEGHLQAYCCAPIRGILEDALSGRLDFLEGAVFPHTCDSIQRLSDIWRMNTGYRHFWDVVWPAKLNTQSAHDYITAILEEFKASLETASGRPITPAMLADSIAIFNTLRSHLSRIHALALACPGQLKGSDFQALVKGSMIMDRKTAAHRLGSIVEQLASASGKPEPVKRVFLSGSMCDSPDIYTAIESSGAVVVGDDLCTGQRWFDTLVDDTIDPIAAIGKRYASRLNCPAKHAGLTTRSENILSQVRALDADGVIFVLVKFCDPHGFDYPDIKSVLDQHHIKNMVYEIDGQQINSGQLATRMETFIQMI